MTDLLKTPGDAVITNPEPRFSWIVNGENDETMQTAYRILVASDEQTIREDDGDVWDSGKVNSGESVAVPFEGAQLEENTAYWWKVRTWDQDGRMSAYSAAQKFNTGDFQGKDRSWPDESQWVTISKNGDERHVLEDRHRADYHEIVPESIHQNEDGHYFISFEKAAFGTLRLHLDPQHADSVVVHLGEKSREHYKSVDRNPGGSIVYERHVLELAEGQEEYELELPRVMPGYPESIIMPDHMPEVTSFRFAEIENYEGSINQEDVRQLVLLYPFDEDASYFSSSDSNLNEIWNMSKHTLKITPFLSKYIDGNRERMAYEADAYLQQISHYSVDREYAIQRYTTKYLIFNPSWPTEWHLHIALMAWDDYMQTGNKALLEKYYEEIKNKAMLPLAREDGLISTRTGLVDEEFLESIHYEGDSFRDIVDWPQGTPANESEHQSGHGSITLEGETDRYVFSDINTVVNAFHYRNLVLISKMAEVLEKEEDAEWFEERAEKVKTSFNEKLFNEDRGLYTDGEDVRHTSLHANMFPAAFGLAPREYRQSIRDFLTAKGMASGPYGAKYLFDALYELGGGEYALRLLTNELSRGWMNMIRIGSTVTTEAWDLKFKQNMTWNHAWSATPAYIIPRKIFGIEPAEPSYRKIRIKPRPGELERAEIKHPTIRGAIKMQFHNREDSYSMEVTLPANTRSNIGLPKKFRVYTVYKNGQAVTGKEEEEHIVLEDISPGEHSFEIRKN